MTWLSEMYRGLSVLFAAAGTTVVLDDGLVTHGLSIVDKYGIAGFCAILFIVFFFLWREAHKKLVASLNAQIAEKNERAKALEASLELERARNSGNNGH